MLDNHFVNHISKPNSDLDLIFELMLHPEKEKARGLMSLVNDIINYYTRRTDNEIRLPIIYLPACEKWAQEICVEFVALKLSLLYNDNIQKRLSKKIGMRDCIELPMNCSKKVLTQLREEHKYAKRVYKAIKDKYIPEADIRKNLLICKDFGISSIHNPYLNNYCQNEKSISDITITLTCTDWTIDQLDIPIKQNKGVNYTIENLVVFLSKTANGRLSEAFSYQRPRIDRLNRLQAGIKNVFYFYFSTKPYKLQRIVDWKLKNAADILHENVKDMRDFISLTADEANYIFGRNSKQTDLIIESNDLSDFKSLVDDALESCEYNVQVRNELALCQNEYCSDFFKKDKEHTIDDIYSQYFQIYLQNLIDTWKNTIGPSIVSFVGDYKCLYIILDNFIPEEYKKALVLYLSEYGINVSISNFKSLMYRQVDGVYQPNIEARKIVLLSYQGHYVGHPYNHYPNSFDPICLGQEQELLNILNLFVLDPYYSAHHYEYKKILRDTLKSGYKNDYLKCIIHLPKRPIRVVEDIIDRTSFKLGVYRSNQHYQHYKAESKSGKTIKLLDSDYVIIKENNDHKQNRIIPVPELKDLLTERKELMFFPLSKLQANLECIIEESVKDIKKDELYIRKEKKYLLSNEEIESESELWEILLRRIVKLKGANRIYNEIMEKIPYHEKISFNSFERWYAPNNDMILPRSRRMQNVLFEYLSIDKPYDKIIIRKKAQKCAMTEKKNSMLTTFLCNNLFAEDFKSAFELLGDNIKNMLGIYNYEDLAALVDLLKREIEFETINTISKYDKN